MLTDEQVKAAFYAARCSTWYETYPSAAMDVSRALLAAHSAGAQESVAIPDGWILVKREHIEEIEARMNPGLAEDYRGCGLYDDDATRSNFNACNSALEDIRTAVESIKEDFAPVFLAIHPQPMPQTDAARDAISLLHETIARTPSYGWVARRDALLKRNAEIERSEREGEAQHGTEKATADAEMKIAQLNALTGAARDAKDAKRYRLLREHYFTRADNPNTAAYHCVGVFTSWMHAPTINREGLDAVLDAEIERLDRTKDQ